MATPARKSASLVSPVLQSSPYPCSRTQTAAPVLPAHITCESHRPPLPNFSSSSHHVFQTPTSTGTACKTAGYIWQKIRWAAHRPSPLSIPQDPIPQSHTPVYIPASSIDRLWKHITNRSVIQATYSHHTPRKSREKIKHPPTKTNPKIIT